MSPSYFLYATQRDVSRLLNTFPELEVRIDEMSNYAKHGPVFDAVKQLVIETKMPSISLAQRTFRINNTRAAALLEALEGDVVTTKDERGMRRMLIGETNEYL